MNQPIRFALLEPKSATARNLLTQPDDTVVAAAVVIVAVAFFLVVAAAIAVATACCGSNCWLSYLSCRWCCCVGSKARSKKYSSNIPRAAL